MTLDDELRRRRDAIDATLDRGLPAPDGPAATVAEAMRYAVFGGGKRLRPVLSLAAAVACGADGDETLAPAAALELVHTYSLIHDDLPSMDDDDLRRGRPTTHRAFDEATAVLAGDALLTLAFEWLAGRPVEAPPERRLDAVLVVARAAGLGGMVGGQVADLEAERRPADAERLDWIHAHKTGALFAAAAELGAIHAGVGAPARRALAAYGTELGLAFQIADDLLDRSATADELGKTPGKDERAGKSTYPSLHGDARSQELALAAASRAVERLAAESLDTPLLRGIAERAVRRRR